jgi:MYXO-CTERM domain-containing protein
MKSALHTFFRTRVFALCLLLLPFALVSAQTDTTGTTGTTTTHDTRDGFDWGWLGLLGLLGLAGLRRQRTVPTYRDDTAGTTR